MFVWDVLFPRFCSCGFLGAYVCLSCQAKLEPLPRQTCLYCRRPSPYGLTHPGCLRRNGIDGALSLYRYGPVMKKVIKTLKYALVRDSTHEFLHLVGAAGLAHAGFFRFLGEARLAPVPISAARARGRGFNQAEIIARGLSRLTGLPAEPLLVRVHDRLSQAQAPRQKRRQNVRHAFRVAPDSTIPGTVLIIDDVITTGETVRELARVLKGAGASRVYAFSVAKG